jgi:hypothetical protein
MKIMLFVETFFIINSWVSVGILFGANFRFSCFWVGGTKSPKCQKNKSPQGPQETTFLKKG